MKWIGLLALLIASPLARSQATAQSTMPATTQTIIDIRDHGARSADDDAIVQTQAIQRALDACVALGGGTVIVPAGVYVSGAVRLPAGVELRLESGAVLRGSRRLEDYRIDGRLSGLISAVDAHRVGLCGQGVIDGNGMAFMDAGKVNLGEDYDRRFVRQGDRYLRGHDARDDGPIMPRARPGNLVVFANCQDVSVSGVTLRNSPYWTLHVNGSRDVVIRDITVDNPQEVPNNDGIHCTTSRDVRISGCVITAGDDAIAISGVSDHGPIIPGFVGYDRPSQNIVIRDCVLRSRSAGLRIGYGHNDVREVVASNLRIQANRGIGIFARDRGSISDVQIRDVLIRTRLYRGHWWGKGEPIHLSALSMSPDTPPGSIRGVRISGIVAEAEAGVVIYAAEPGLIEDVAIEDLKLSMRGSPLQAEYGGNIDLRPAHEPSLRIFAHDIPAILARGVRQLRLRDLAVKWPQDEPQFFTHAVQCDDFDRIVIEGLREESGGRARHAATILLRRGSGAVVRNVSSEVPDVRLISQEHVSNVDFQP
jgi:hypothetical protein